MVDKVEDLSVSIPQKKNPGCFRNQGFPVSSEDRLIRFTA
jgi:hypothetical protein